MDWRVNALIYSAFHYMPFGAHAYEFTQRRITRTVPRQLAPILSKSEYVKNARVVAAHFPDLSDINCYEFGAGWDLLSNLVLYCFGVERQTVGDVTPLARRDLINSAIEQLPAQADRLGFKRCPEVLLGEDWVADLKRAYGISYVAPMNPCATGLSADSIDLMVSAHTFEHVPWDALRQSLHESYRICRQGALVVVHVNYTDHYFYKDRNITPYNFLRYSPRQWRWFNPSNHYQNRKRHVDYRRLFEEIGFQVVDEVTSSDDQWRPPPATGLSAEFRDYSAEELRPLSGRFTLTK